MGRLLRGIAQSNHRQCREQQQGRTGQTGGPRNRRPAATDEGPRPMRWGKSRPLRNSGLKSRPSAKIGDDGSAVYRWRRYVRPISGKPRGISRAPGVAPFRSTWKSQGIGPWSGRAGSSSKLEIRGTDQGAAGHAGGLRRGSRMRASGGSLKRAFRSTRHRESGRDRHGVSKKASAEPTSKAPRCAGVTGVPAASTSRRKKNSMSSIGCIGKRAITARLEQNQGPSQ